MTLRFSFQNSIANRVTPTKLLETVCYLYIENAKNLKFAWVVECRGDLICLMSTKCCHRQVKKKNRRSF